MNNRATRVGMRVAPVLRALATVVLIVAALVLLAAVGLDGHGRAQPAAAHLNLFVADGPARHVFRLGPGDFEALRCDDASAVFTTRPLRVASVGSIAAGGPGADRGLGGAYRLELAWTAPDGPRPRAYELSARDADSGRLTARLSGTTGVSRAAQTLRAVSGLVRLDPGGRGWIEATMSGGRSGEVFLAGTWACDETAPA